MKSSDHTDVSLGIENNVIMGMEIEREKGAAMNDDGSAMVPSERNTAVAGLTGGIPSRVSLVYNDPKHQMLRKRKAVVKKIIEFR